MAQDPNEIQRRFLAGASQPANRVSGMSVAGLRQALPGAFATGLPPVAPVNRPSSPSVASLRQALFQPLMGGTPGTANRSVATMPADPRIAGGLARSSTPLADPRVLQALMRQRVMTDMNQGRGAIENAFRVSQAQEARKRMLLARMLQDFAPADPLANLLSQEEY